MPEKKTTVLLDQLILATDNPRHEVVEDEGAAILRLCGTENIDQLARDIAEYGINPGERLIVFPLDESDTEDDATFIVAEGNRRVCALKLLNDPDLAPASIRKKIESYAASWTPISELDVVIIPDEERRRHWLMRIHDGAQGGRGRMPWKSEQKTRFTGGGRNAIAQALLDYAEAEGMIAKEDRAGRISHLTRLIGNPLVRDTLGLKTEGGPEELERNRAKADFDLVLTELLEETKTKSLGSQANKQQIDSYAHKLQALDGLGQQRLEDNQPLLSDREVTIPEEPESEGDGVTDPEPITSAKKPPRPQPPKRSYNLDSKMEISQLLEDLKSEKLAAIYWSICTVNAQQHTPLVAVGVWAFLRSLAAMAGASDDVPFFHFWKAGRISQMDVAKGDAAKAIVEALERLSRAGNTTKHDAISAHFDYRQLINDWNVVNKLVLAQIKELKRDE